MSHLKAGRLPMILLCLALTPEVIPAAEPEPLWQSYNEAGWKALGKGRASEAERLFKASLKEAEKLGAEDPHVAFCLHHLAAFYLIRGQYAKAEPLAKRALTIRQVRLGPEDSDTLESLDSLGVILRLLGKYAEAEPLFLRSIAIREKQGTSGVQSHLASSLDHLAELYREQGRYEKAEPLYRRSLTILKKGKFVTDQYQLSWCLTHLAELYRERGNYAKAEQLCQQSLAASEACFGPESPGVIPSIDQYAAVLWEAGRSAEADRLAARARAIRVKHALRSVFPRLFPGASQRPSGPPRTDQSPTN